MSERKPYKPIHPNRYDGRYKVEVLTDRYISTTDYNTTGTAVTNEGVLIEWSLVRETNGRRLHIRYFNHGRNLSAQLVTGNNPGIGSCIDMALDSVHLPDHCGYWFDEELMADANGEWEHLYETVEDLRKAAHETRLKLAQEAEKQYDAWHEVKREDGTKQ